MRRFQFRGAISNHFTAELYQLSAIYPNALIHHLTVSSRSPNPTSIPLPSQITHTHTVPASTLTAMGQPSAIGIAVSSPAASSLLPLPYAPRSLTHIRSATLPALLPASQIPDLLRECHRVLVPGGILEMRIIEPLPERESTGPKMRQWVEERIVLNLERQFRTARPGTLVEGWVRGAGFNVISTRCEREGRGWGLQRCLRLPAATPNDLKARVTSSSTASSRVAFGWGFPYTASTSTDSLGWMERDELWKGEVGVDAQVGSLVLRSLWRDVWGEFVDVGWRDQKWWWEDGDLVKECVQYNTRWEIGTLVAVKGAS